MPRPSSRRTDRDATAHRARRTVAVLLLAGVLAALAAPVAAAGAERSKDPDRDLAAVVRSITALESWMGNASREQRAATARLRELERREALLQGELAASEARLLELQDELAVIDASRAAATQRLEQSRRALATIHLLVWKLRPGDWVRNVLSGDDPDEAARRVAWLRALQRRHLDAAAMARTADAEITALAASAAENAATAATRRDEQQAALAEVAGLRDARTDALATLEREMKDREGRLQALRADRDRLTELVQALARQRATPPATAFARRRGKLPWPVPGRMVARFGAPRSDERVRWQGVVIAAAAGTPVRAVHAGEVVFADWLRGFGMMVILDHGNGYLSLYGRNERVACTPGQQVAAGDVIGSAGRSGGADADGVYFEIRANGQPVDPAAWLARTP